MYCQYHHGEAERDKRGNCATCGAPLAAQKVDYTVMGGNIGVLPGCYFELRPSRIIRTPDGKGAKVLQGDSWMTLAERVTGNERNFELLMRMNN